MIGAEIILTGKWTGAGVFNMEQNDPDPFMDELNRRGSLWHCVELTEEQAKTLKVNQQYQQARLVPSKPDIEFQCPAFPFPVGTEVSQDSTSTPAPEKEKPRKAFPPQS